MNVFVTGASGWIGEATVRRLLSAGHEVSGLARSAEAAAKIQGAGVVVVRGELHDLDVLQAAAAASDGVVHLAFRHDVAFSGDFASAAASDRTAIAAMGEALAGTDKPLLVASGTLGLAPGRVGTELDLADPAANPRVASAALTLALADRGVRSVVVRFAPTVHGPGDGGFIATLIDIARETGVSGYLDGGANRWPAVHIDDAAALLVKAVESAPPRSVLHATGENGVTTKDIATAIGHALNLPVRSVPDPGHFRFRFLAGLFAMDAPASSNLTRALLDWQPTGPSLLQEIEAGVYTP
jgi:nucleoside-diphosphate-sugar epimerase